MHTKYYYIDDDININMSITNNITAEKCQKLNPAKIHYYYIKYKYTINFPYMYI